MLGTGDDPFFRAVCSCGWRSELVPAQRVHREWEDHVEDVRRRRSGTPR